MNKDDFIYYNNLVKRKNNIVLCSSKLKIGKEKILNLINEKLRNNKKFSFFNFSSSTYGKKIETLL